MYIERGEAFRENGCPQGNKEVLVMNVWKVVMVTAGHPIFAKGEAVHSRAPFHKYPGGYIIFL
jgi:hypothetical protein